MSYEPPSSESLARLSSRDHLAVSRDEDGQRDEDARHRMVSDEYRAELRNVEVELEQRRQNNVNNSSSSGGGGGSQGNSNGGDRKLQHGSVSFSSRLKNRFGFGGGKEPSPLPFGATGDADDDIVRQSVAEQKMQVTLLHKMDIASAFDSVSFDVVEFIKQLLTHTLLPVSIIFVRIFAGAPLASNQGFSSVRGLLPQLMLSGIMWTMLLSYVTASEKQRENVPLVEVMVPLFLWFCHRLMIATKWAYMPRQTTAHLRSYFVDWNDTARLELVTGWLTLANHTITLETDAAAARMGIDLENVHLHARSSNRDLHIFLDDDGYNPRQSHHPNLKVLCGYRTTKRLQQMADLCCSHSKGRFLASTRLCALIGSAIPSLVRLYEGHGLFGHGDWHATVVIVSAFAVHFLFFNVLLLFLGISVLDHRRRHLVMKLLDHLIDPSRAQAANKGRKLPADKHLQRFVQQLPIVDLTVTENIMSWLALRQVADQFGLMYRKRVDWYTSYAFLAIFAVVAVLLQTLLSEQAAARTSVAMCMFYLLSISAQLMFMAVYSAQTTKQQTTHVTTIRRIQFAIREQLVCAQGPSWRANFELEQGADRDRLKGCDHLLDSLVHMLTLTRNHAAFKLLGFDGQAILRAVPPIVVGGLSVALRLLTQQQQ